MVQNIGSATANNVELTVTQSTLGSFNILTFNSSSPLPTNTHGGNNLGIYSLGSISPSNTETVVIMVTSNNDGNITVEATATTTDTEGGLGTTNNMDSCNLDIQEVDD